MMIRKLLLRGAAFGCSTVLGLALATLFAALYPALNPYLSALLPDLPALNPGALNRVVWLSLTYLGAFGLSFILAQLANRLISALVRG